MSKPELSLNYLLSRIEELEKEVGYLQSKPPVYVPPPTYGPLPGRSETATKKLLDLCKEDTDKIKQALTKQALTKQRKTKGVML